MKYLSVVDTAKKWNVSERSVRNYCAQGRVLGAFLIGKTWSIPAEAEKPQRAAKNKSGANTLLEVLRREKKSKLSGGIYHKIQVDLTYNSNHIEGSRLSLQQTRHIFETNTVGIEGQSLQVDDIIETNNHFRCIDLIIDEAEHLISQRLIKQLHGILKNGTSDSRKDWFAVGDYKRLPNEIGGKETTLPEDVGKELSKLINAYNQSWEKSLEEILDFHVQFENIHPFQDGNGRVARLIMFKECLRNKITPFILTDEMKFFYYRGLNEWNRESGFLRDTCLSAQDEFSKMMEYFRINNKGD